LRHAGDELKKILIVDDEVQLVELLLMVLDDGQCELLCAYDGEEALELVRRERPSVVLSDVMMPRLNGQDLCRQMKADSELVHIPVILMSAMHRLDASECGAEELIRKPFDIMTVRETVNRLLSSAV
jgi:DNA-binding response OmpR family regulator